MSEMIWDEMRWDKTRWDEIWCNEMRCKKIIWEVMKGGEMKCDETRWDGERWWDDMALDEIEWYYTKSSNVVQYSIIWIFLKITVYWKKSEKMRSVECTPDFTISSGFWNLDGGKNCWQVGHFLENFVEKEQDMNIMMKEKILTK